MYRPALYPTMDRTIPGCNQRKNSLNNKANIMPHNKPTKDTPPVVAKKRDFDNLFPTVLPKKIAIIIRERKAPIFPKSLPIKNIINNTIMLAIRKYGSPFI